MVLILNLLNLQPIKTMKIISSFIITCTVTFLINLISASLLYILYIDILSNNDDNLFNILIDGIVSLFAVAFIYVLIYIPVYLFNKKEFMEEGVLFIYKRYLFIVLIPFIIIFLFTAEFFLTNTAARISFIPLFISAISGFYIFIKRMK